MDPHLQPLGVSVSQINQLCVDLGFPRPQSVIDNIPAGASHRIYKLIFAGEPRWQDVKIPHILALRVSLFELIPLEPFDTASKIIMEADSRFRSRNEVACAIFSRNYSGVTPRVYLYGYGIDGPLGAPWVLMDFFYGTTLESQLPGLSPAQQYATAEVLISLLQRSHRSRLPASGRIQPASHMKDEGAPALWTRDQHHDVITIQSICSDSESL